ncbi:MAG TPA: hypothetical protein PKA15_11270, partial [Chitinophagales bacterium]|nr:hypothetical protein [Chitinophagales bacterium]
KPKLKPKIAKEPPKPTHGSQKGSSKLKRNMTGKINTERLTTCIKHLAVSGLSSVSARIKGGCNLSGNRFEMPNVSYTQPL